MVNDLLFFSVTLLIKCENKRRSLTYCCLTKDFLQHFFFFFLHFQQLFNVSWKQNKTHKNNKVIRRVRNDKIKQNTSSWNIDFVYFQEKYKTRNNYLVNWFYTRRKRIPQRLYSFSLIIQLKIHYVENCNHSKWLPWKINLFNYEIRFFYLLGYKLVFNFDDFCFRVVISFRIFFNFH